jgi:integrase/recombinase XerD
MALNKRKKRVPVGKMTNQKEYPQLTLEQAVDLVISGKTAEGLRERTLRDYEKDWNYFMVWLNKNYEIEYVDELTPHHFRDYINYLKYDAKKYDGHKYIKSDEQGVGLSETTINIRLRVYKAIFNYLDREDLIEVNPMTNIKLLKQDIDLTNCLSDEEVKEILRQPNQRDYVGYRDYVAIILLLDSGIRASELLSLRKMDIDFKTRFITLGGEKNKNRKPRIVPISGHTVKLLLQLINENGKHFSTDRIFLSSYGEPLGQNHFNKRLKYYGDKAGIKGKKMTAHVYRHTWAKNMTLNGCDAFTLQKMGGWSDIRTMRRYIQMDTDDLRISHDQYSPVMKLKDKTK